MRYQIIFQNDHRFEISQSEYAELIEQLRQESDMKNMFFIADNGLVNCDEITCIEQIVEGASGQVITPKTPEQVQEDRDREFAKVTQNPDNVISRARGEGQ